MEPEVWIVAAVMSVPTLLYCVVYGHKFTKTQSTIRSAIGTARDFSVGWFSINIMVGVTYGISMTVRDELNKSVLTAYTIMIVTLWLASVIALPYRNLSRYYKSHFV